MRRGILLAIGFVGLLTLMGPAPQAKAQFGAVGFLPIIGSLPDGVIMNVTPVVTADRRYVRMTVNPVFIAVDHFDTFFVPAAVGGGGIGGGFGGFGGGGGGLGGGGGGGGGRGLSSVFGGVGAGPTPPIFFTQEFAVPFWSGPFWFAPNQFAVSGMGPSLGLPAFSPMAPGMGVGGAVGPPAGLR